MIALITDASHTGKTMLSKNCCLIMGKRHIGNHFDNIKKYADIIEKRPSDESCTSENVLEDNAQAIEIAQRHNVNYVYISTAGTK